MRCSCWSAYAQKGPVAASLRELTGFDRKFFGRVIKPMLPVILNELFWSLGITTYNVIYARIGTASFAAMNIVSTVEQMAFVLFFAVSSATSVMVGNNIGAGQEEKAHTYAGRSLYLAAIGGLLVGSSCSWSRRRCFRCTTSRRRSSATPLASST
jgi:Na+-driven multidrug efflux pump